MLSVRLSLPASRHAAMQIFAEQLLDQIRSAAAPEAVLRLVGYHPESIQSVGHTMKAFCPIHRSPVYRTLLIDSETRSFRCSNTDCEGHKGGDMIDLYSIAMGVGYERAIGDLAAAFNLELDLTETKELLDQALKGARNLVQIGDLKEAELEFKRLLHIEPRSIDALEGLCALYEKAGRGDERTEIRLRLARALAEGGRPAEAAELFREDMRGGSGDERDAQVYLQCLEELGREDWVVGELVNLADRFSGEDEIDRALAIYRRLETMQLDSIDVSLHIVELLRSSNRNEELLEELVRRADGLKAGRSRPAAIQALRSALEIDPARDDLRLEIARIAADPAVGGEALEEALAQTRALIERGSYETATEAWTSLFEAQPDCTPLVELRGDLESAQGRREIAYDYWLDCADIYENRKDFELALGALRKAIAQSGDNLALLSRQGLLLDQLGRTQEAIESYGRIVSLLESSSDYETAANIYAKIIDLEPESVEHRRRQFDLYLRVGFEPVIKEAARNFIQMLTAQGNWPEAARIIERTLETVEDDEELLTKHGETLAYMNRDEEAAEAFLAASRLLASQQRFDLARDRAERALRCSPENRVAAELRADALSHEQLTIQAIAEYSDLAESQLEAGDGREAIRVTQKILALDADHLPALQLMARACEDAGDTERQRTTQMRLVQLFREARSPAQAALLCEQILTADQDFTPAIEQMIALANSAEHPGTAVEYLMRLARIFWSAGRTEEEHAILERVLARDGLNAAATRRILEIAGQSAFPRVLAAAVGGTVDRFAEASRAGDAQQIIEELNAAMGPKPEFLGAIARLRQMGGDAEGAKQSLLEQADSLAAQARYAEAIDVLGEVADMQPASFSIRKKRIDLLMRSNQKEAALAEYRALGKTFLDNNHPERAAEVYQDILNLAPGDPEAGGALISLYLRQKDLTQAAEVVEDLAAGHVKTGNLEAAAQTYERIFEFGPDRAETLRGIIEDKQRSGDATGALLYYMTHQLLAGASRAAKTPARGAARRGGENLDDRLKRLENIVASLPDSEAPPGSKDAD